MDTSGNGITSANVFYSVTMCRRHERPNFVAKTVRLGRPVPTYTVLRTTIGGTRIGLKSIISFVHSTLRLQPQGNRPDPFWLLSPRDNTRTTSRNAFCAACPSVKAHSLSVTAQKKVHVMRTKRPFQVHHRGNRYSYEIRRDVPHDLTLNPPVRGL